MKNPSFRATSSEVGAEIVFRTTPPDGWALSGSFEFRLCLLNAPGGINETPTTHYISVHTQ